LNRNPVQTVKGERRNEIPQAFKVAVSEAKHEREKGKRDEDTYAGEDRIRQTQ
jgi:hypothetical protein